MCLQGFVQRLQNLGGFVMNMIVWTQVIQKHATNQFWVKYNIPPYSLLQSNREACLVLLPTHWAVTNPQPLAPHMHVIGPLTATQPKPLPHELEAFVQSAGEHGVVFASLGTTAIPDQKELKQLAVGLSALAPTQVIWKLADSDLLHVGNDSVAVGDNVRIVKWAPQNDILGHPNVKAFFTQGGTNSFNEAAYHGVPIVGMPLFGEQPDNIAIAKDHGFGLPVSVHSKNMAADVTNALKRVLREPSFAACAARTSRLMQARRSTPAEDAASAIEHAVWTAGDTHLQPWRHDLSWFQMMSFDVILTAVGLLLVVFVALLGLIFLIIRKLLRIVSRRSRASSTGAKKTL
ncbi:UDP-glycosyltransferase [Trebouxia sp. C0009 RCD-2024]